MFTRREFLQTGIAASGGGLLAACTSSRLLLPDAGPAFPPSLLSASRAELDGELTVVAGQLPTDLSGHMLVNAAVPWGDGTPLFNGDGMIYRLSFDTPGRVRLRSRLLRTPCFLLDEAARGRAGLEFSNSAFVRLSPGFGARNFGNTAIVPFQDGRLLATYDAGRPWEIDPVTLDVITPLGLQSAWQPYLPAITPGLGFFTLNMATAHPCFDADDQLTYLVNYAPPTEGLSVVPFTRVLWWDGTREPVSTRLVDATGQPVHLLMSCHQMQVTRDHVVLLDGAFQIEPEQMAGQDVTRAQVPSSVIYIVRKADLVAGGDTPCRRVEIPIESAHFLVDRDDSGGRLTLMLAHQNSADPSEWVRGSDLVHATGAPVAPDTVGMMVAAADRGLLGRYVVDVASGQVVSQKLLGEDRTYSLTLWTQDERQVRTGVGHGWWSSLGFDPALLTRRIADVYADHPHRQVALADLPTRALPPQLLRVDHESMAVDDSFELPLGHLPMSPTFVPRRGGGPDDGYLVIFAVGPEADEVWILDAGDLARGPLCRLRHPGLDVAFTLHSTWVPELRSRATPAYLADRGQDYGERLASLPADAQALARQTLGL